METEDDVDGETIIGVPKNTVQRGSASSSTSAGAVSSAGESMPNMSPHELLKGAGMSLPNTQPRQTVQTSLTRFFATTKTTTTGGAAAKKTTTTGGAAAKKQKKPKKPHRRERRKENQKEVPFETIVHGSSSQSDPGDLISDSDTVSGPSWMYGGATVLYNGVENEGPTEIVSVVDIDDGDYGTDHSNGEFLVCSTWSGVLKENQYGQAKITPGGRGKPPTVQRGWIMLGGAKPVRVKETAD